MCMCIYRYSMCVCLHCSELNISPLAHSRFFLFTEVKVPLCAQTPCCRHQHATEKYVIQMSVCHRLISLSVHTIEYIMQHHFLFGWVPKWPQQASVLFAFVLHVEFDLLWIWWYFDNYINIEIYLTRLWMIKYCLLSEMKTVLYLEACVVWSVCACVCACVHF